MSHLAPRSRQSIDPMIWLTVACVVTVLFLHHANYTKDYLWEITHRWFNPYSFGVDKILQQFAVGGFFLMSGFKLTKSKRTEPAWDFICNRWLRIYPLYLLTVILFSFTSYPYLRQTLPSLGNFMIHALCLQAIVPGWLQENYNTIWFVSNLMCYYGLFLMLRRWVDRPKQFLVGLAVLLGATTALHYLPLPLGKSLMIRGFDAYLIYFAVGMLYAEYQRQFDRLKIAMAIGVAGVSLVLLLISATQFQGIFQTANLAINWLQTGLAIGAILPLHGLILKLTPSIQVTPQVAAGLQQLTFASFGIFLLHRPVWSVMAMCWSSKSYLHSGFMLGLGMPLIFGLSYALQNGYNKALRWYLDRQKLKIQTP